MPVLSLPITRAAILAPRAVAAAPPGGGTPTFVQVASNSSTGNNTVNVPTGTLDNDVMIAFGTWANATSTITDPSGWTFVLELVVDASRRLRAYYRVASAEPASYAWAVSPSVTNSIAICSYRGCKTAEPIDGTPVTATVTSATPSVSGITTANDNTMLVMAAYAGGTRNYVDGTSTLGNERADLGGPGTLSLGVFDGVQATAGASGSKSVTLSSSSTTGMMLLGIKPSGGV